jgi:hypothetical protein
VNDEEAFIEGDPSGVQRVGTRNAFGYVAPVAEIYGDSDRFCIVTDSRDGNVWLPMECLPLLIEALQKMQAATKT